MDNINPYMCETEKSLWENDGKVEIGLYTIQPKKDFGKSGFYDAATRSNINMGWIITKGGAHAVPGAGWYHTLQEAKAGVYILMACKDDPSMYHNLNSAMRAVATSILDKRERAAQWRG